MIERNSEKIGPTREGVMWLIFRNGRVLLEERNKQDKSYYGYTIVPGGKLEDGEEVLECLEREIKEEHGVIPTKCEFLDTFESIIPGGNHYKIHAFLILDFEGEIVNNEPEKTNLKFVRLEHAQKVLKFGTSKYVLLMAKQFIEEERCKD